VIALFMSFLLVGDTGAVAPPSDSVCS
jgi:hypothetical protein